MTAKQKAARAKFKQVVAEAKKLRKKNPKLTQAQAVKQAWAIAKKVGAIKIIEKGESKSARPSATYQQKRTKKGTYAGLKKVGSADAKWGVYTGSSLRETFSDEMAAYRYADLIRSSQKLPSTFVKVKKIRKSKKVGAVKKKAAEKSSSYHKDTKSHNVNIRVVSGLGEIGKKFKSLSEVKSFHISKGGHWFDRDTMKYFKTKIESKLIAGKYFVYSNQMPYENRVYKIAEVTDQGNIFPVISAPRFETANDAKKYLAKKIF